MPEALQSAWVNAFGSPGLSKTREPALARRFMRENPDMDGESAAHNWVSYSPNFEDDPRRGFNIDFNE